MLGPIEWMAFHGAYICVSMSTCCIQNSNHCNNLQGERGLKWPLNSIIVTTHKHADMVALINIPGHLYHTLCVCGLLITLPDLTLTNTMRSRILFRLFGGFSVFHFAKFLSVRRQCGFLTGFRLTLNQEPTEVYILLRDTYTRVAFTWTQTFLGLLEFQVPTHCRHCERVKIYGSFKCQWWVRV